MAKTGPYHLRVAERISSPIKSPLTVGVSGTHLMHGSLGPRESAPPKRHLDLFSVEVS